MDKIYTYRRHGKDVAYLTKHSDGTASVETPSMQKTFATANSAFAAVNGWLWEMDAIDGFR